MAPLPITSMTTNKLNSVFSFAVNKTFRKVLNTDKHSDNSYTFLPLFSSYNLSTLFLIPHNHSTWSLTTSSLKQELLSFKRPYYCIYMIWPSFICGEIIEQQNILKFEIIRRKVHTERKTLRSNYAIKNFLMYYLA